jgi:hypothetical protein
MRHTNALPGGSYGRCLKSTARSDKRLKLMALSIILIVSKGMRGKCVKRGSRHKQKIRRVTADARAAHAVSISGTLSVNLFELQMSFLSFVPFKFAALVF